MTTHCILNVMATGSLHPTQASDRYPLERFEAAADAAFASQPLPHPNAHVSAWYLLNRV